MFVLHFKSNLKLSVQRENIQRNYFYVEALQNTKNICIKLDQGKFLKNKSSIKQLQIRSEIT